MSLHLVDAVQEADGVAPDDVCQVVPDVVVAVALGLAVDGERVVVVSGVADEPQPPVPARRHVLHPAPRPLAVLVQVLAGVHRAVASLL